MTFQTEYCKTFFGGGGASKAPLVYTMAPIWQIVGRRYNAEQTRATKYQPGTVHAC